MKELVSPDYPPHPQPFSREGRRERIPGLWKNLGNQQVDSFASLVSTSSSINSLSLRERARVRAAMPGE